MFRRAMGAIGLVALGPGLVGLASCASDDGTAEPVSGTVDIVMKDTEFSPSALTIRSGDEVTFHFTNEGKLIHEGLIGDEVTQEEHEAEMTATSSTSGESGMSGESDMSDDSQMDGMDDSSTSTTESMEGMDDMDHESSSELIVVDPGKSADLSYTFEEPGTYLIGCHQPDHYAAGMKLTLTVV